MENNLAFQRVDFYGQKYKENNCGNLIIYCMQTNKLKT